MKMLDLEALTDILREYPNGEATNEQFAEWLEEQDAEDIIHCYECQHYDNRFGACRIRDDTDTQFVDLESYCSYGERKESEEVTIQQIVDRAVDAFAKAVCDYNRQNEGSQNDGSGEVDGNKQVISKLKNAVTERYPDDSCNQSCNPKQVSSSTAGEWVSREDALMALTGEIKEGMTIEDFVARTSKRIRELSSATPDTISREVIKGKCKDCRFFEYDHMAMIDGIPLIIAHEMCTKWGDGCKTREDGYCFMFEDRHISGKEKE